jgi:hypothetical protein
MVLHIQPEIILLDRDIELKYSSDEILFRFGWLQGEFEATLSESEREIKP